MNVTLVPATRDDLPRLFEWRRQMWCSDLIQSDASARAASEEAMQSLVDDQNSGRLWVIQHEHRSVGFVALVLSFSLEFGGRVAFIDELFIDESSRGKGVGSRA